MLCIRLVNNRTQFHRRLAIACSEPRKSRSKPRETPAWSSDNLRHDTIHSWEDLKKLFIDNFQGSIHCPATRHDLRLYKQERGEALRSYIKRFFNTRATIANIADDDVIDCFHNGLATQQLYHDFGRNRPRSVVALRDMMLGWTDQEEQERDRFPRQDDNNQKRNGDLQYDKNQRNFDKKRKLEDTMATMDQGQ